MAKKKTKKEKPKPVDGLGPDNLKRIHKAVRQVWSWSYAWRLAKKRSVGEDGFPRCEKCAKKVPRVSIDHIKAVGEIGGKDYIKRMFCPSKYLQALCDPCHRVKTKADNAGTRAKRKPRVRAVKPLINNSIKDFF